MKGNLMANSDYDIKNTNKQTTLRLAELETKVKQTIADSLNNRGRLDNDLRVIGRMVKLIQQIRGIEPEPKLGHKGDLLVDEGEAIDKAEYLIGER